jgi:hypothetical protein
MHHVWVPELAQPKICQIQEIGILGKNPVPETPHLVKYLINKAPKLSHPNFKAEHDTYLDFILHLFEIFSSSNSISPKKQLFIPLNHL